MPACKTERQERFAHYIAQGMSQIDAYEAAGYSRCGKAASRAARRPGVVTRVRELRHRATSRTHVTLASLLEKAEDARVLAMQNNQPGAAVSPSRKSEFSRAFASKNATPAFAPSSGSATTS